MPCPNYRRKRTISKAFRVSREESDRIELLARAAGVTQQEYIMAKFEDREFTVVPDIRTYKMLRDSMRQVYQELCRLRDCSTMDERLIAKIELLRPFRRHRRRRPARRARDGGQSNRGNRTRIDEQCPHLSRYGHYR